MVDTLLMILGFVGAVGDGLAIPAFFMFTRVIFNDIGQGSIEANVIYLVYLAGGSFLASFMEGYCWSRTGERQASRMQAQYLTAVLRQDVEYFDLNAGTSSEVITSITSDSLVIEDCLSKKVPNFIMNRATLVGCYAGGFSMMWRLALVGSPTAVLLVIPGILYGHILMELARKVRREYQKADTVVEQCVSSINTVYSFVEEERTIAKFSATLDDSVKLGLHQGLTKGLAVGSNGIIFAIMAFLVWFGSHIIMYNGGKGGTVTYPDADADADADVAAEVVEVLTESVTLKETPVPTKVARLMLVSDILHNSSAPIKNASAYHTKFEATLPDIIESFTDLYHSITGRITAEA
ncbi:putative multidrug resistance protein [Zingiber officinale]|uniref:putative multidrug resistance protein n=1 Tax=Zingiber officinale TaxID=94328 RepID=UPI001C4B3083|nr:putative multidrug resistance protein [Zingiber officinale]